MENIRKIFNYPLSRLILWGILKSFILAIIASLLLALSVVVWMYGPTFDMDLHFFGTAPQFFVFALIFITVCSIPIAGITAILLAIFIRADKMKNINSYKRIFLIGLLLGGTAAGIVALAITVNVINAMFIIIVVVSGLSGGFTGLWMMRGASELWLSSK